MGRGGLLVLVIAILIIAGIAVFVAQSGQEAMDSAEETISNIGTQQALPLDVALVNLKNATEAYDADNNAENCTQLKNMLTQVETELESSTLSTIKQWAMGEFIRQIRERLPENCGE